MDLKRLIAVYHTRVRPSHYWPPTLLKQQTEIYKHGTSNK